MPGSGICTFHYLVESLQWPLVIGFHLSLFNFMYVYIYLVVLGIEPKAFIHTEQHPQLLFLTHGLAQLLNYPGWAGTCSPSASASNVLGLQACTTMSGYLSIF